MKIVVPASWEELTNFQQKAIIQIINEVNSDDFSSSYLKIVQVLLMKKHTLWQYLRMRCILRKVSISAFEPAVKFLQEKPKLYTFPKIKGVLEPAPRIGDLTIEQFSLCDTLLYRYNEKKQEVYLRQLVACLYRLPDGRFDKNKLPEVAKLTDKISLQDAIRIGFIFSAIRIYIADAYPTIFINKKPEEDQSLRPVFSTNKTFTPFSQIIVMMAADELRLLGNLRECQSTLVYDFLNAFVESKKIHKIKQNAQK
ncbi:hypothetical protein [Riemerella columbipharyngis]|uniref:Uncharacterized protein n=1 Tax=Riemerella columbipharyngis TaxID=1071918 RepID=A0A1G7FUF2_9FLAO|nr:hypothetical protein [Riemerella columbipharyngis]SDE79489.1 hypothetical protein SAMN05421544_1281 [Riemerella columbipharyngis]